MSEHIDSDCDICRGSGYVRLPVWPKMSAAITRESSPVAVEESSRSYPCPQCANIVSDDHVKVLGYNRMVDTIYMQDANYMSAMRRSAAHAMVDRLVEDGYVAFRLSKEESDTGRKVLRAELGAVSPAHVATLDARIAERQREVADEVAAEAIRYIYNWGSYFGRTGIAKDHAAREIKDALKNVLLKRGSP